MTYKPVRCELTVLTRCIYPAMKGVFTQRNLFLICITLSIPYYLLRYFVSFWAGIVDTSFLFVVLMWMIHDNCVKGRWTHEYRVLKSTSPHSAAAKVRGIHERTGNDSAESLDA